MTGFYTGCLTELGKDEIIVVKECYADLFPIHLAEKKVGHHIPVSEDNCVFLNGSPFLKNKIELPCGRCLNCKIAKSKEWAIRCCLESTQYLHNWFITLTYDELHVPKNGLVSKDEFQRFMKRLRKEFGEGIRFFGCGEYGSRSGRPHYHLIVFNCFIPDLYKWSVNGDTGDFYYRSPRVEKCWKLGNVMIGEVTFASCAYVARYVSKKVDSIDKDHQPFLLMSRRPGIGAAYFDENLFQVYNTDKIYQDVQGQTIHKPPRYFDYLLSKKYPELLEGWKDIRKFLAINCSNREFWLHDYKSVEELREAMEEIKSRQLKRLKRGL